MRINDKTREALLDKIREYFGARTEIWLFGSRVDDQARGGDIDIYIEPEVQDAEEVFAAKLRTLVALKRLLGDRKIDLVINRKKTTPQAIYEIARTTGIKLT